MIRESGVSNVVGVVLLLFLVMVTSAVLGLVLSSATYDAVDTTPDVIFTVSEDPYLLYHGGGDILYKNDLVFYAGGDDVSGSIFLEGKGDSWSNIWTDWHTGQAIKISDGRHSASDLAIVALDSRGNAYLVYNGPTADPIPSGKPVPDVTPKPTVTPTPVPVKPDASFTLTLVNVGQEVSPLLLPDSLVSTANHFVVMEWIDKLTWVNDFWLPFIGWVGHWKGGYTTYVEFTAVETEGVTYSWSSTGPDSHMDDSTSNPAYVRFNTTGDYSITLEVTNTTSGVSNSSIQTVSVRNPGITVMTWIKHDGWSERVTSNYYYYPSFETYNNLSSWSHKWGFTGHSSTYSRNNNNNYDLVFKLGGTSASVQSNSIILNKDTWYHVTGTFEETEEYNSLNLYFNGQNKDDYTTSSSLVYTVERKSNLDTKIHFVNDERLSYEIPFAMTAAEIQNVYNAEKFVIHT